MENSLITIATFDFADRMGLVRSKLEAEGIECFVQDELVSQTYIVNAVGGMKLQVRQEDAGRATQIVKEMGIFDEPDMQSSRLGAFERATGRFPLLKGMGLATRFFALLVLIAVILTVIYMLAVL
ncbi:putative signal transducing protein [Marinilabilia salmonicolor]|uniref:putative signal transducing protein n=1 Tax=Marinilabilia salmonicolor TaxID=989 RepID=UPI00029B09A9|nr:DUF2007 domain-containing protein [Marinilabilia salmonicolor]